MPPNHTLYTPNEPPAQAADPRGSKLSPQSPNPPTRSPKPAKPFLQSSCRRSLKVGSVGGGGSKQCPAALHGRGRGLSGGVKVWVRGVGGGGPPRFEVLGGGFPPPQPSNTQGRRIMPRALKSFNKSYGLTVSHLGLSVGATLPEARSNLQLLCLLLCLQGLFGCTPVLYKLAAS